MQYFIIADGDRKLAQINMMDHAATVIEFWSDSERTVSPVDVLRLLNRAMRDNLTVEGYDSILDAASLESRVA